MVPEPALPADAATVIWLRPAAAGFEAFLLRRALRASFMSNAFVFPGGRLDEADLAPEALALVDGVTADEAARALGDPSPARALGLYVAAARELFEESGVLLTRPVPAPARLEALRARLRAGEQRFAALLAGEGLRLAADRLLPWARWVTPAVEPKRFDARFFVAVGSGEEPAAHDGDETIEARWASPAAAVAAQARGDLKLPPPTLHNLVELAGCADLAAVRARAAARTPAPIQPRFADLDGTLALVLPWDPRWATLPGGGAPLPAGHPATSGPSRIVLQGSVWACLHGEG